MDASLSVNTILAMGGIDKMGDSGKMFILNREGADWIELAAELPHETEHGGAVVLNEELYIFGGSETTDHLYKLDKATGDWIRLADMNEERWAITNSCLAWNGSIWVLGGYGDLKSVERYDPEQDKWIQMPDMKYGRKCAAAAVWNGKIVVCGGWNQAELQTLDSVECFDPESGVWTELAALPTPRHSHSLISYNNRLLAIGGHHFVSLNSVMEFDPLEGKWNPLPAMKHYRNSLTTVILGQFVYVIGGYGVEGRLRSVEIFNGVEWQDGPELPYERHEMFSAVIPREMAAILESYEE